MASRSSATPLALLFAAMVVYASLYPFEGWRLPGHAPWIFLIAPLSRYWTWFDVLSNLLGYAPLGFFLALGFQRSGRGAWSWVLAVLLPLGLSLTLETIQNFLPRRIPSNLDLGLNLAGALLGASSAWLLERLGGLQRWSEFRRLWFEPGAHGSLVLLALWPFALLYPASVPFGLGQVRERIEETLWPLFADTPFQDWLPDSLSGEVTADVSAPVACIALGLLVPVFMGYADIRTPARRMAFLGVLLLAAFGVSGLSSALTYGPEHAWAWIATPVMQGVGAACAVAVLALALPARISQVCMVCALVVSLGLLNRLPSSAYLDQSLEVWEQGRFIRFHGVSQWLGWLWPFAALVFGVRAVTRPPLRQGTRH
ncbi:VanZ family protein [Hydrogenophaga sp.]|uniref:VanZ family protein n=1 Tax=Hydrogenophaga sp. TaxID=1904254 RepID=UPI0035B41605